PPASNEATLATSQHQPCAAHCARRGSLCLKRAKSEKEINMTTMTMRKPHADRPIKGLMAKWYANNTGEMMKEDGKLADEMAGELPKDSSVLEVAPGRGYFCIELAKRGPYTITGLDLSDSFVKMAAQKAAAAGVEARFIEGSASNMPFPKGS